MGWTSTADPLEHVGRAALFFYTKEEAMTFCEKHGWEFTVDMPAEKSNLRQKRFNAYGGWDGLRACARMDTCMGAPASATAPCASIVLSVVVLWGRRGLLA